MGIVLLPKKAKATTGLPKEYVLLLALVIVTVLYVHKTGGTLLWDYQYKYYTTERYDLPTIVNARGRLPRGIHGGLPALEDLFRMKNPDDAHHSNCPEGTHAFENIVLPETMTHAHRNIPKVIHMTAKSRCVSSEVETHIHTWKFTNHSLYLHDDESVYQLLEHAANNSDGLGTELVRYLSKILLCVSSGATLSDLWRYIVIYYYGGIYTDLDNVPGKNYTTVGGDELIPATADAFFFVEPIGTMSQFYFAASPRHPLLLYTLHYAVRAMDRVIDNVMVNNPAKHTGPGAIKNGMILFQRAVNITSDGCLTSGTYEGGIDDNLLKELPWYDNNTSKEMADYSDAFKGLLETRSVTIMGDKDEARHGTYIETGVIRWGSQHKDKKKVFEMMNMSHYHEDWKKYPQTNKIGCRQHIERMEELTQVNTSYYYHKTLIQELKPKYQFSHHVQHYIDLNTNDTILPWTKEQQDQALNKTITPWKREQKDKAHKLLDQ